MYYGPSDFQTPNIISIGPLRRLLQPITNDTVNLLILEQPKPEVIYPQGKNKNVLFLFFTYCRLQVVFVQKG